MEALVYSRLSTDSTLAELVGTRIYPATPPEDPTLPYVVYYSTGSVPVMSLAGLTGLNEWSLTVEIVATTFVSAQQVGSAILTLLNAWSDRPQVQGSFLTEQTTEPQTNEDRNWFLLTQTYQIFCI